MKCIIIDDEPLAREAIEILLKETPMLQYVGAFNSAGTAADYMKCNDVDLVFLDIQMPGVTGLEFARTISPQTLVIFTTAYSEYAIDSYDVDAIDFLVKPIEKDRFIKAVKKAVNYHSLLTTGMNNDVEGVMRDSFFVKSERRYCKVVFDDILYVEGLKDYSVIHLTDKHIITKMNLKNIFGLLSDDSFFRINKSYIVNLNKITAFDNNDVCIGDNEIAIGNIYRDSFFEVFEARMGR